MLISLGSILTLVDNAFSGNRVAKLSAALIFAGKRNFVEVFQRFRPEAGWHAGFYSASLEPLCNNSLRGHSKVKNVEK